MPPNTLGFIGAGRIVRILLAGWKRAGWEVPRVVVSDIDQAAIERLPRLGGRLTAVADNVAAARQDIVFLAVHPPALVKSVAQVADALQQDAIVVSLAPKITIATLTGMLKGFDRIARVIPNAPSLVNRGFNPAAFGPSLSPGDRSVLRELFDPLGDMPCVNENTLEAYAVISAMGPTYLWPQFVELFSLAESFGLGPNDARLAVRQMVEGAMTTLNESGLTAEEVMDLVPVRPLADFEPALREAYRAKLTAIMDKIRP